MYDIYTGLKLDEEQVRAGRETEEKRMLEFEVYEEVTESLVRIASCPSSSPECESSC